MHFVLLLIRFIGARPEVEIYVDGNRCMIDGIWYKPSDSVVVLDAAIGKYNAKYLFLANDEVRLVHAKRQRHEK